jgi:hypothetical protein
MDTLIAALTGWIAIQMGFSVIEPPHIFFVPQIQMNKIAYGSNAANSPYLRATYSQQEKTIYLRENWNSENLTDRSILVHELVHHFQIIHDIKYECHAARERLAYDLQFAWLRKQGVNDPYELLQTNELFISLISTCIDTN